MKAAAVAALLAAFSPEDVEACVNALPRWQVVALHAACEERVWTTRLGAMPPTAAVVVTGPPPNAEDVLTAEELAEERKLSLDTIYRMEKSGELVALPRRPHGRLRFRRGDQPALARGIDRRYTSPHDTPRRQSHSSATRDDATPARGRPQRDRDDRRPLGTRGAGRDAARGDEPWAPGQAAWAGPPDPRRPKG